VTQTQSAMPGLGDEFRAAREARHLSLIDVSDNIHIRTVYLQSIEDGDPTFAAPVYVRGFIRTYARFLGLDPEGAVANFASSIPEGTHKQHESVAIFPLRQSRPGPSPWLWVAGGVAALLVVFVGFRYAEFQRSGPAKPAAARVASAAPSAVGAKPIAAAAPKPRATPALTRTLEIRVSRDSWMSVTVDGASRVEGLVKAGTTKAFHGTRADVRAGNAGGVEITVNGKPLGKMGNTGAVVERSLSLAGP